MKKLVLLLSAVCLLLFCFNASAETAPELTSACTIKSQGKQAYKIKRALDRDYATGCKFDKNKAIDITSKGNAIGGLYLKFFGQPYTVDIQVEQDGTWQTVASAGTTYVEEWIALPQAAQKVRILNTSGVTMCLNEIYVYGEGEKPA